MRPLVRPGRRNSMSKTVDAVLFRRAGGYYQGQTDQFGTQAGSWSLQCTLNAFACLFKLFC